MRALLDINVLIALFDPAHIHHARARGWWGANKRPGWASCALTQNGFVRVVSKPGYERPVALQIAVAALARQIAETDHAFWPEDISIADAATFDHGRLLGPSQITDAYLLALAVKNGGRLATFDRGVPLGAVRGAEARHIVVL